MEGNDGPPPFEYAYVQIDRCDRAVNEMANYPMTPEVMGLVSARFKVLSEPLRLQLLHVLQNGERSVTDLAAELETSQPNVSKHLKLLQESGFVSRRQEGNTVFYAIADPSVYALCDLVCSGIKQRLAGQSALFKRRRS